MINMALAMLLLVEYHLEWRDLPQQVLGRNVSFHTPEGVRLKGRVLAIEQDGMRLKITRSSDRRAFPKGDCLVPRGSITQMEVNKTPGHTWRVVGITILGALGITVGVPLLAFGEMPAAAALVMASGLGLGYLCGWGADRKVVRILVVP